MILRKHKSHTKTLVMKSNQLISQFIPQCLQFSQKSRLWAQKSSTNNSIIPHLYLSDHSVLLLPITGEKPKRPVAICLLIPRRHVPKNSVDDLGGDYDVRYNFDRIGKYTRLILNDSGGIYGGLGGLKHQGVHGSVGFCPKSMKGSEASGHFCSGCSEPET